MEFSLLNYAQNMPKCANINLLKPFLEACLSQHAVQREDHAAGGGLPASVSCQAALENY